MSAGKYDFRIEKGADWFIVLGLTKPDDSAFDLTDHTGLMTCSGGFSPTVTFDADRTLGRLTISLTDLETTALSGKGTYAFYLDNGTTVSKLIEGLYEVV